jgi:hypothetical protein
MRLGLFENEYDKASCEFIMHGAFVCETVKRCSVSPVYLYEVGDCGILTRVVAHHSFVIILNAFNKPISTTIEPAATRNSPTSTIHSDQMSSSRSRSDLLLFLVLIAGHPQTLQYMRQSTEVELLYADFVPSRTSLAMMLQNKSLYRTDVGVVPFM